MPIVSPPVDAPLDNSEGQFPKPRFVPLNQPDSQAIVPPVSSSIVAPQDKAERQSAVPQSSPLIVRLLDNPEKQSILQLVPSEQTPVLLTSDGGADSEAHKDVVINHQASGASSVKKRKLRSSGSFDCSKKYYVKFEGNSSKKWDGKTIAVEDEQLENYSVDDLHDGASVTEFWGSLILGTPSPKLRRYWDPQPHIYGKYGDPCVVIRIPTKILWGHLCSYGDLHQSSFLL